MSTNAQRTFLLTILVQAVIVLSMVAVAFGLVESAVDTSDPRYKTLPCYLALFGLAELFELVISVDALRLRNVMQLVAILIFHVALIIFSVVQIHETQNSLVVNPGEICYATCDGPGSLWFSGKTTDRRAMCTWSFSSRSHVHSESVVWRIWMGYFPRYWRRPKDAHHVPVLPNHDLSLEV